MATASERNGVTRVLFVLSGGKFRNLPIGRAALTKPYGWVLSWNTSHIANGTYEIRSVAYDSVGARGESGTVTVYVRN